METVVLHVSPEAEAGGPLALVEDGDTIELDVPHRRLDVLVSKAELERRRASRPARPAQFERGYAKLYVEHVLGADRGADFDFLVRQERLARRARDALKSRCSAIDRQRSLAMVVPKPVNADALWRGRAIETKRSLWSVQSTR